MQMFKGDKSNWNDIFFFVILLMEAKVSSRPGQEGKVDGYLLEGNELDEYLNQTKSVGTPDV